MKTPASEFTLMFIKPDASFWKTVEQILDLSAKSGFVSCTSKAAIQLNTAFIEHFYAEHVGKSFFYEHSTFLQSGLCSAYLLKRRAPADISAAEQYRQLVGNTDPQKAAPDTLRRLYGSTLPRNAVHASDSVEAVKREALFFFSGFDLIRYGAGELVP
jgi:nucleoside-diphosphate kinase